LNGYTKELQKSLIIRLFGYDLVGMNHVNMFFVRQDINTLPILDIYKYAYYQIWGTPTDRQMMSLENTDITDL